MFWLYRKRKIIPTNHNGIWETERRPVVSAFLNSALYGGGDQLHASAALPRGKRLWYPLNWRSPRHHSRHSRLYNSWLDHDVLLPYCFTTNLDINTFAASYLNTQGLNNSCLKSPASTLVDLTFQTRALRSFSLNQLCKLSL